MSEYNIMIYLFKPRQKLVLIQTSKNIVKKRNTEGLNPRVCNTPSHKPWTEPIVPSWSEQRAGNESVLSQECKVIDPPITMCTGTSLNMISKSLSVYLASLGLNFNHICKCLIGVIALGSEEITIHTLL